MSDAWMPDNCPVRQHTADGRSVGRCWHWLGKEQRKVCPVHGDVTEVVRRFVDERQITNDYDLAREEGA